MQNRDAANKNFMSKIVPVIFLNFYRGTTYSSTLLYFYIWKQLSRKFYRRHDNPLATIVATADSGKRDSRFRARNESGERILVTSSIILRGMSQSISVPAPFVTRRTPSLSFHFAFQRVYGFPGDFPPPFQASLLCTARNSANDLTPLPPHRRLLPAIPPLKATTFSYPKSLGLKRLLARVPSPLIAAIARQLVTKVSWHAREYGRTLFIGADNTKGKFS